MLSYPSYLQDTLAQQDQRIATLLSAMRSIEEMTEGATGGMHSEIFEIAHKAIAESA